MAERYDPLTEYLKDKAAAEAKAKAERERLEAVALLKASIPYSREMVTEICDLIAEGATLKDVCAREHTPTHKIVRRWFKERPEFAQAFAEAERERLRSWEDQLIEVARDDSRDHVVKDNGDGPQKNSQCGGRLALEATRRNDRPPPPRRVARQVRRHGFAQTRRTERRRATRFNAARRY